MPSATALAERTPVPATRPPLPPGVQVPLTRPHLPVGANYYMTSDDWDTQVYADGYRGSPFIRRYDLGDTRALVRAQLKGMADAGAEIIKTPLWFVREPDVPDDHAWRLGFPMTKQEAQNLHDYIADVASIRAADGHSLELDLTLLWLGCADYTQGSPETTVGGCGLSWDAFVERTKATVLAVTTAGAGIVRSDGQPAVKLIYLEGEVRIGSQNNQDRFLLDLYPFFLRTVAADGITGSVYFWLWDKEAELLDDSFVDPLYPLLNGHRSVYWLYRSVEFMRKTGLPVPARLDFSFYPTSDSSRYATLVARAWDDMAAVFPNVPAAVVETDYQIDPARRLALGQAFATEYFRRGMPQRVVFWPGGYGWMVGYPFDFASFAFVAGPAPTAAPTSAARTPPPTPSSASCLAIVPAPIANAGFENGTGVPVSWDMDVRNGYALSRSTAIAHSGTGSATISAPPGTATDYPSFSQAVTTGGFTGSWRVRVWVRTSALRSLTDPFPGAYVFLNFVDARGALTGSVNSNPISGDTDWTAVTVTATGTPAATVGVRVTLMSRGGGQAWFDDIELVQLVLSSTGC